MKVYVAKNGGFCAGVRRAVETAFSVPAENTYVLGELIHNEEVVEAVAARGIRTVASAAEVPRGGRLIIRSHGAPQREFAIAAERGVEVVDCTCPFVARTQRIVAAAGAQGKTVAIAGDRAHPEVAGLIGWCAGEAYVFASAEEDFGALRGKEVVLVAQTTFPEKRFSEIAENLQKVCPKTVEIFPTICYTTVWRQKEAAFLARACEAVVVIGGLKSGNTRRLGEIAEAEGAKVIRVAKSSDFDYENVKFFNRIGVIAGASTPDRLIQEVLFKMVENNAEVQETEVAGSAAEAPETEVKAEEIVPETAAAPEEAPAKPEAPEAPKSAMTQILDDIDKEERYRKGQIIKVRVALATDDGIFVSGSGKLENKIPAQELDCEVYNREVYEEKAKAGEEIEVMVIDVKPPQLSEKRVKKLREEEAMLADIEGGKEFSVVCTGTNKGGLTAELGTYPVFVPRREIRIGYVSDLEKYVGKTLRLKLIEIRKERRKEIIASQRTVLEAEKAAKEAARAEKEANFFENINVGDVVEGKVERATSFGAFVSVGGFDCLAHISDLAWSGVKEVTEVLEIGKRYQFKVLKVDREAKKVSIGYKQLQPQPWELAAEKYAVGDVVHGKVVRIVPFGAFVELERGIDGLVHVSQITHEWLENPTKALSIGQEVDAQILAFDPTAKKITLSIKALQPREAYEPRPEQEEPAANRRERGKKSRRTAQSYADEDEYREWKEGGDFGASISELLGSDEDKK